MGFNEVYWSLQEIFPQIDARALKAVAMEHSKDADAAVEAVLVEIIPFFNERSRPSSPSMKNVSGGPSSSTAAETVDRSMNGLRFAEAENDGSLLADHDASEGQNDEEESSSVLRRSIKIHEQTTKPTPDQYTQSEPVLMRATNVLNTLQIEASGVLESEEISVVEQPEWSTVNVPCYALESLQDAHTGKDGRLDTIPEKEDRDAHLDTNTGNNLEKVQEDFHHVGNNPANGPASLTIHDQTYNTLETVGQSVSLKPLDESFPTDAASMTEHTNNIDATEDESSLKCVLSQSTQNDIMDVLQEMIEDARNHKKTLLDAKESVISLMKEAEIKELAAKEAEEEAASGWTEIWVKVEELKQMLQHAKGANDMHAGDVYAEKSVLTTELRELRSRVLSMSDERDKYLALLNEMRQTLEERLVTAENKITSSKLEKQRRERAAREALAEQDLIMEKVVAESKILTQQAEENTRLREFLVDRGRFLDTLQGEITVIYQDITLLKAKCDENVPFSNSHFSSHSNGLSGSSALSVKSVIGAHMERSSSASSLKSINREPVDLSSSGTTSVRGTVQAQGEPMFDVAEAWKKTDAEADEQVSEDEARDDQKAPIEEGWDFFDNCEIDAGLLRVK